MAILLGCAAVMLGGMFYLWTTGAHGGSGGPNDADRPVAFKVGATPIYANQLNDAINRQLQQQTSLGGPSSPMLEVMATKNVIDGVIEEAARAALVAKNGIKTDDATLKAAAQADFEEQLDQAKMMLQMQGKLKPGSTDADFEKALKEQTGGKGLAEIKADREKALNEQLAEESGRQNVIVSVAPRLLQDYYVKTLNPTDDEVKASFNNVEALRLLVSGPDADAKLKSAQDELAKGTPFEKVVDKYSTEPAPPGKKASANKLTLTGRQIAADEALKPLLNVKPGQVSPVITLPEGKAIYKVLGIKSTLKDFDKNRDKLRKDYIEDLARQTVQKQLDEFKKTPGLITFTSPAYKAFYDFSQATANPNGSSTVDAVRAAYDEAKQAEAKNQGYDARIASLARYAASNFLWGAPGVDKEKFRQERVDTLVKMLESTESYDLRKELFDLYLESKQYDAAAEQLVVAAQNNASYDAEGVRRFNEIRTLLEKLQSDKHVSEDQVKAVQTAQLNWSRERANVEKQKKEEEKAAAEARAASEKEAAAEKARQEDEAKAAKKSGSGSTTPPPNGSPKTPVGAGTSSAGGNGKR